MKKYSSIGLLMLLLLVTNHCFSQKTKATTTAGNLYTFGRLYGYVKHFYPGDEARMINWDQFAVYGAEKVKNAKNNKELKSILDSLFKPIAPLVQIGFSKKDLKPYKPAPKKGDVLVSWQHHGLGDSTTGDHYKSIRLGRDTVIQFPFIEYYLKNVDSLINKKFTLNFYAKSNCSKNSFGWLAFAGFDQMVINNFNKTIRITDTVWKQYEIKDKFPSEIRGLYFEAGVEGNGEVMVDKIVLKFIDLNGREQQFPISNNDFNNYSANYFPSDWQVYGNTLNARVIVEKGSKYLALKNNYPYPKAALFIQQPMAGEAISEEIGNDIYCQVPLALYLPKKENSIIDKDLKKIIDSFKKVQPKIKNPLIDNNRYAAIIILWNEIQHFYPYFDYLNIDWKNQLLKTLREVGTHKEPFEMTATIAKMAHHIKDRHFYIACTDSTFDNYNYFPAMVRKINDSIVVTLPATDSLKKADIIISINNVPAKELFEKATLEESGSERSNDYMTGWYFLEGHANELLNLQINRDGYLKNLSITRGYDNRNYNVARKKVIDEIEPGIYFIDLNKISMFQWDSLVSSLTMAKGIIFDLSRYPNRNHQILRHFIDKPIRSANWSIPTIIYPDHNPSFSYDTSAYWILEPLSPLLKAKPVFLISNRAQSYAESVLEMVETYKLGILVGEPTAGINGMVNSRTLPGSFITRFTGCRVVKQNGKQLFTVGIQPDYLVEPDYESIKNGIDKPLLKAIEIIKSEINK
jgi:C-terminal processing protease CtpA/Prc